ncbi:hypothetical protein SRABI128_02745 [Microbacterium sp. Bi128]|nr:hypothetical protein SRABI128_02745 [Microbacterium sp. Bi128]
MILISCASPSCTRARIVSGAMGVFPVTSTFCAALVQPVTRPPLSFSTTSGSAASSWKFSDAKNRSGNAPAIVSCTCAATFQPTRSMSWNGPIGRPSGANAFSTTVIGVPSYTARAASPITLASSRFTTKPGASAVSTAFLPSPLATTNAVDSAASAVASVFTISMRGITATGLKKWKPTSRSGCASAVPISATDSDEVLVARIVSSETIFSIAENTSCLTPTSSNTASMTKSQSANSPRSVVPCTSARSWFAVSASRRPLASSVPISSRMDATPLSTRPWSRSVMTTGTRSLRTNSSANCEAMRPAPMTPTFVTFFANALSGAPTGRLARFCTRSNAYMDAANWSPVMRSASASSSRAKPSAFVPLFALSSRSSAT